MLASELVILRHAEARCDVRGVVGGAHGDTGLTRDGRLQAASRAAQMALEPDEQGYSVVYTGRQPRLAETALVVAAVLGVPLHREAGLAGLRYGPDVDGRPWADVDASLGGSPQEVPDTPLGLGGETWNQHLTRFERVLRRLTDRHPGQRIVVIGEEATVDASLSLFLAADKAGRRAGTRCTPAGLTRWREAGADGRLPAAGVKWSLVHHNHSPVPIVAAAVDIPHVSQSSRLPGAYRDLLDLSGGQR